MAAGPTRDGQEMNEGGAAAKQPVSDAILSQSKAVWWDMLIKDLTETMHKKSKEIVQIYDDRDGSFKVEGAICSGNLSAFK